VNRTILIADDEPSQRELLGGFLRHLGYEVQEAVDGVDATTQVRAGGIDLVLLDQRMPRLGGTAAVQALHEIDPEIDVIVITAFGSVNNAVDALKAGAVDYLTKPLDLKRLQIVTRKAIERRQLLRENRELRQKLAGGPRFAGIEVASGVMEELLNSAARVAPTEATVLLSGESGTGKELLARAIHAASPRAGGPFVAVHCAALAEGLLESELFGHLRGAFTGADRSRAGRFEAAAGGTLLLDEIGEIAPGTQVKLLRVLQERQVERVGSNQPVPLDVRLIAATNRDPIAELAAGRLREDLYYRLAVVRLHIPPLRVRRADIPKLVEHFLRKHASAGAHPVTGVSRDAMEALVRYDYPGNVRELENIILGAIVMSRGDCLTTDDLPFAVRSCDDEEGLTFDRFEGSLTKQVENLERRLIEAALEAEGGVQCRAAVRLGISERTLRYKLDKYRMRSGGAAPHGLLPSAPGREGMLKS
jgi:DNA-binding NtrC family response regulator